MREAHAYTPFESEAISPKTAERAPVIFGVAGADDTTHDLHGLDALGCLDSPSIRHSLALQIVTGVSFANCNSVVDFCNFHKLS